VGAPAWSTRRETPGITFDLDAQLGFLGAHLGGHIAEFSQDVRGVSFELWNGLFQAGDAEVLYALVRHLRPGRIVEVGSGNSTLVTAAACRANAREGAPVEFVAIDPAPQRAIAHGVEGLTAHEAVDVRTLPVTRFETLQPGDILFIDTHHVVKRGSEVNWLFLEVLPRLRAGVWVHVHDVFLPYDYPPWSYWLQLPNEQYLLQALMIESAWRAELALATLFIERPQELTRLIPSLTEPVPGTPQLRTWYPASFWLRKPPSA
jgi:hypothetical protein